MPRRNLFSVVVLCALVGSASAAVVCFEDDFSSGALDSSRWTESEDPGCSVAVNGEVLQAFFTGANEPRGAYARSTAVELPADWTSFTLRGRWAFVSPVYGEMLMRIWDADDETAYAQARYQTYTGVFNASHPADGVSCTRTAPSSLTEFEWVVTPTGWTFREFRGGEWDLLANLSATDLAVAEALQFRLGGWEYSSTSLQRADYDDIELTAVPAPPALASNPPTAIAST